LTKKNRYWK